MAGSVKTSRAVRHKLPLECDMSLFNFNHLHILLTHSLGASHTFFSFFFIHVMLNGKPATCGTKHVEAQSPPATSILAKIKSAD